MLQNQLSSLTFCLNLSLVFNQTNKAPNQKLLVNTTTINLCAQQLPATSEQWNPSWW